MLPFPVPKPTGLPPSASQESLTSTRASPVKPHILPLHARDKPLPLSPTVPSARSKVASSDSGEDTQRGFKGWWKRNRQRSKGSHSPGQAELGVGSASATSPGSQRTRYDVEVLTRQFGAVSFGTRPREWTLEHNQQGTTSPLPVRPVAVQSSPAGNAGTTTPEPSRRPYRPPVYASHVGSEHLQHSVSAPQLEVRLTGGDERSWNSSHGEDPFNSAKTSAEDSIGARVRITTFEPDSRALERLPDRPATYVDVSQRSLTRPLPQTSWTSSPQPSRSYETLQNYHLPLTPSRKLNASSQTPITPTTHTPTGHGKTKRSFIDTPGSQQSVSVRSPTSSSTTTVQCSGFTQKGQRCKKRVRAVAAYYSTRREPLWTDDRLSESPGACVPDDTVDLISGNEEKRFCKVHIGQICTPEGFYFKRNHPSLREKWIHFSGEHAAGDWKK